MIQAGIGLFIIFASLFNVSHASNSYTNNKLSLRCNSPFGYVEQPSGRDFITMKLIPLSKTGKVNAGKYFAQVDDDDYEFLMQWDWHVAKRRNTIYATRSKYIRGSGRENQKNEWALMHREILGVTDPKIDVDHKDHDGLNCQKSNLRKCNQSQNCMNMNRKKTSSSTSKYRGVSFNKDRGKYKAQITHNKVNKNLGRFDVEEDAARAYDAKAKELFGEFANLNFK